jgi:hypothetical protein
MTPLSITLSPAQASPPARSSAWLGETGFSRPTSPVIAFADMKKAHRLVRHLSRSGEDAGTCRWGVLDPRCTLPCRAVPLGPVHQARRPVRNPRYTSVSFFTSDQILIGILPATPSSVNHKSKGFNIPERNGFDSLSENERGWRPAIPLDVIRRTTPSGGSGPAPAGSPHPQRG